MGLLVPSPPGEYLWRLDTHAGRPSLTKGASVTPAQNSKGSWTELIDGALVTTDVWMIYVVIQDGDDSTVASDMIIDIGIDPTAGTSYSVIIPDLLCMGPAVLANQANAVEYCFPLHIPAGSSIAARCSVNRTPVTTVRVSAILYGKPSNPEITPKGQVVEAIGITAASSTGTAVTPGTASEGSWTSLGTVSRTAWFWQVGMGLNDSTTADRRIAADLSAGSAGGDIMILEEQMFVSTSLEATAKGILVPSTRVVPAGSTVYGRLQNHGTLDSGYSMAAYAVS